MPIDSWEEAAEIAEEERNWPSDEIRGYFSIYKLLGKKKLTHQDKANYDWAVEADCSPVNANGNMTETFYRSDPRWEVKNKPRRNKVKQ